MTDMRIETPAPEPQQSTRRAWWIVGGSVTAVVMLVLLVAVGVSIWAISTPEKTASQTETYTQAVTEVEVSVEVGRVALTAADGDEFQLRRDMSWRGLEPAITEEWADADSFEAEADCRGAWLNFGAERCNVEYSLSLPPGTDAGVHTSVADIGVDGLDGALRLGSSVGEIEARNLRTTETVVSNSVGDVSLEFAEVLGDIEVSTSVGDVTILVPDDGTTYDVRFESSVGESVIDIRTDPTSEADYLIEVSTSVGDLEVRYA